MNPKAGQSFFDASLTIKEFSCIPAYRGIQHPPFLARPMTKAKSPSAITITRKDLFAKVWSSPMLKLAAEFGVSDVALAKVCKKLHIPRPARGYWAKLAAGKRPKKPTLSPASEGSLTSAVIDRENSRRVPKVIQNHGVGKIEIPEDLRGCHPFITATRKRLSEKQYSAYNLREGCAGTLNVRVGENSISRAMRFMQAFLGACLARQWEVQVGQERRIGKTYGATRVVIDGQPLELLLSEKVDRTHTYELTGKLQLRITNKQNGVGLRGFWSDGADRKLEDFLPDIIATLPLHAEEISKAYRLCAEQRRRDEEERAKERRRIEEINQRIEAERQRVKEAQARRERFVELANDREQARLLEAFIAEIEERIAAGSLGAESQFMFQWLTWAKETASQLDPFLNGSLLQLIKECEQAAEAFHRPGEFRPNPPRLGRPA